MKKIIKKNVLININGKNFKCECGANVFTKYEGYIFKCHCCGKFYEGGK